MATKIQNSEISVLPGGTTSLKLYLDKGAQIKVQPISLRAFSTGIVHYKEKISSTEKEQRKNMGESSRYDIVEAKQEGWVILSRERPSTLIEFEAKELFAAVTSFFASEAEVIVEPFEVKSEEIKTNSEAGKYWQRYKNPDKHKFYLGFDSGVIPISLEPDETVIVYHGYWLAMESGLQMVPKGNDLSITNKSKTAKMLYIRACNFQH